MKKTQKLDTCKKKRSSNLIIINNRDGLCVPLFCPICEFVMNTSDDFDFYQEFSCCEECGVRFAQSRRKEWLEGWRPEKDDIKKIKKEIGNRSLGLFLENDDI
tara:strand:- start:13225 stop:13533 length:309 start_codon:yes stop_codon:yes gene_type:complete